MGCPGHSHCTKWSKRQLEVHLWAWCNRALSHKDLFSTPSTHLTACWSHGGNDTIHRGWSSHTFLAWFPPHTTNPSIMSASANIFQDHRRVGGRGRGVSGLWLTTNTFPSDVLWAQRGVSIPEAQGGGVSHQTVVAGPRASPWAVAPSFWGGKCWTNLTSMNHSCSS